MWSLNIADLVSFVAFGITIWQVRRAASIAQTAKDAVESASMRAAIYQLLLLAPGFERCEAQLESAAMDDSKESLLDHVREWRRLSAEILGLLTASNPQHDSLIKKIQEAAGLITAAKKRIIASESGELLKNTEKLREAASEVTGMVVTLASQIKTNLKPLEVPDDSDKK